MLVLQRRKRPKGKGTKTPPSGRKETKTPPRKRKKSGDKKDKSPSGKIDDKVKVKEVMTIDLPESPGARRKNWIGSAGSTPATTPDDPPNAVLLL